MLTVKLICVGKLKEKYYIDACQEYRKRLGGYCRFELLELNEHRLSENPSEKEITAALEREAAEIVKAVPDGSFLVPLCIEGKLMPSEGIAGLIAGREGSGRPKLCFVIGGSYGLSPLVKQKADLLLSMSPMTFPHHLARVMLLEQLYRGFKINEGSRYHK